MRAIVNTCRTLTPTQAVVGVVVWLMIIIGASQAIITSGDPAPCTPQPHVMFNTCATLDTTQVQDRRTQAPTEAPRTDWPMATDTMPACTEEDGSEPGQPLPCLWEPGAHGNGAGAPVVITEAPAWPQDEAPSAAPSQAPATQAPTTQAPATEAPSVAPTDNGYGADPVAPTMAPCTSEDGSDPGQTFPCEWNGATMGNGQGDSYVLTGAL